MIPRLRGIRVTPDVSGWDPGRSGSQRRRAPSRVALRLLVLGAVAGAAVLVFPSLIGIPGRLSRACAAWLTVAAVFELISAAGYVAVFTLTFCRGLAWRRGSRIGFGSLAAGVVLPAGSLAGPALGAMYSRSQGTTTSSVASRVTAFFVLTNAPNLIVIAVLGLALWTGLVPGPRSEALTVAPAAVAVGVLAVACALAAWAGRRGTPEPAPRLGATAGLRALTSGAREAVALIRSRDWRLSGALASYAFDNAALWAAFNATGGRPALTVVIMAFLIGGLGNAVPLPAGVGGTELGLFGSLVLYGAAAGPGAVAVLAYRVVSTAVPLVAGAVALHGLPVPLTGASDPAPAPGLPGDRDGDRHRRVAIDRGRAAPVAGRSSRRPGPVPPAATPT